MCCVRGLFVFFNCMIFSSASCWSIQKKKKILCVPDPPVLRVTVLLQPYLHREEILENRPPSVRALTATLMQSANSRAWERASGSAPATGAQRPPCALTSGGRVRIKERRLKIQRNRSGKLNNPSCHPSKKESRDKNLLK